MAMFFATRTLIFVTGKTTAMLPQAIKYKKWIPVFLLLVIVMPLLASVTIMLTQQVIHFQMLEELESKNLTTIIIKKNNLKWIRQGKEIAVDGKLFDVKDISIKGADYVVRGLYDEKEATLVQLVKKMQRSPARSNLQLLASKMISSILFVENKPDWQSIAITQLPQKYHLRNSGYFICYCPAFIAPPPKYS